MCGRSMLCSNSVLILFYFVRGGAARFQELSALCTELVERWDDLGAYFGVHRSNTVSETRNIASMETQVFNDALSRPRFAVLKFLAETSQYKSFECFLCPGVSVLVLLYLLIWVLSTSELLGCVVFRHVGCESPVCFSCCKVSSFVFCWTRSELVVRAGVGCFPSRVIVSGCRTLIVTT